MDKSRELKLTFRLEQEVDGRYIAEVLEIPGVLAYGQTEIEALERARELASQVIESRIENGEEPL